MKNFAKQFIQCKSVSSTVTKGSYMWVTCLKDQLERPQKQQPLQWAWTVHRPISPRIYYEKHDRRLRLFPEFRENTDQIQMSTIICAAALYDVIEPTGVGYAEKRTVSPHASRRLLLPFSAVYIDAIKQANFSPSPSVQPFDVISLTPV